MMGEVNAVNIITLEHNTENIYIFRFEAICGGMLFLIVPWLDFYILYCPNAYFEGHVIMYDQN